MHTSVVNSGAPTEVLIQAKKLAKNRYEIQKVKGKKYSVTPFKLYSVTMK